ncbi:MULTISPECIES: hypothetical protein [unclassified Aeromicrobium]|uniref:hypothetical protein n=1 Tax=unclassified Aeromicrobium TaxID=2633570 RepID=UPI00288B40EC|nr:MULTISPECIES: hypothetical protein [unclassified Aeromicrobium]
MPDSPDTRERSFLSGLSWFQVLAGALAAMTSAWVASALGVGGTIIGAALGSLVVTITSTFYASTLDRGRTLIVQTDSGTFVETDVEPGHTAEALAAVSEATHEQVKGAEVVEDPRRSIRWKTVALTTAIILAVSGLAMGAYEIITDKAYGSDPDNARIGNPFGGGSKAEPTEDAEPQESSSPDPAATPTPTRRPTATATPTPTGTPTPTPAPTATATTEPPVDQE